MEVQKIKDINFLIDTDKAGSFGTYESQLDSENNPVLLNINGELKAVKDISLVSDNTADKQNVYCRLMTQNPEWFHHLRIGANLSELVGRINNQESANIGIANISRSLSYDSFLNESEYEIKATPVNKNTVLFIINIYKDINYKFFATLDYENGIINVMN